MQQIHKPLYYFFSNSECTITLPFKLIYPYKTLQDGDTLLSYMLSVHLQPMPLLVGCRLPARAAPTDLALLALSIHLSPLRYACSCWWMTGAMLYRLTRWLPLQIEWQRLSFSSSFPPVCLEGQLMRCWGRPKWSSWHFVSMWPKPDCGGHL